MKRKKDMKPSSKRFSNIFFRKVQKNGTSYQISLSKLIKQWTHVRVTVLQKDKFSITLLIEDLESV